MIYKFSKTLTYSDVKWHFFALPKLKCENFAGIDIQIECSDGSKYASKIDNYGRIKALQFFKDHPWAEEGDTFDFEVDIELATVNIDLSNQDFDNAKYSAERELSPANEAEVRDFIAERIQKGQLDSLSLYQGIQGIEFDTKEVGRIDLLCTDQQGNFVVIEIKKDRSGDKVVGQIQPTWAGSRSISRATRTCEASSYFASTRMILMPTSNCCILTMQSMTTRTSV